jgi:phosphoribosylformimino-5-aminoimidazole carboxamide ribotide isomerase
VIVVPAVDLRDGRVVRLRRGEAGTETFYDGTPADVARRWEGEGAERLHVVDLDAAIDGRPQHAAVASLIDAVAIPVEVGGGLRDLETARRYRERGADRIIFGTAAVAQPELVREALGLWPEAVAVALDARDGRVATAGWRQDSGDDALELARSVAAWGVRRIQYTDVSRDGMLTGPNLKATEAVARACGIAVTAAGGVGTLEHVTGVAALEPFGVDEVIVGKALYEGRFDLAAARAALAGMQA